MSDEGLDKGREIFTEEANELLTELETSLLELEETPTDEELIGRVFRAMHTIKGSGAMFGFEDIAHFTHEVETAFDMVRTGKMLVTKELMDLTLRARDQIRAMLDGTSVDEAVSNEIIAALRALMVGSVVEAEEPQGEETDEQQKPPRAELKKEEDESVTYRIRFKPHKELFLTGSNPLLMLNELRELGNCVVIAQTDAVPDLSAIDAEACYTSWDIVLTTTAAQNAIKDVFIFVQDICDLSVEVIEADSHMLEEERHLKLGEILISRGDVSLAELQKVLGKQKRVGEILVDSGIVKEDQIQSALVEQQHIKEVRQQRAKQESMASIRVPSEKLDGLVDLVGELVTVQARLTQTSAAFGDSVLSLIAEEVERITWELRDRTMGIRMMPIGGTFSKFKRLVRDLSSELGKDIVMTTDGAETELDKTVIEKLNDPLVHIIRNSIDHGIESPEVRVKAGKPRHGTVHLAAGHSGANVVIQIDDDGAGLDTEAILNKAIKNGLITPETELSEREIFSLIFEPGFSTAKNVTSVSGRGVGMDVVKKNIMALRGTVDIKSKKGVGSSITLKLPLTLAIIDGLLVKISDDFYVIPLSVVHECVELTREDIEKSHGRHISYVRGAIVPYIRLREYFMLDSPVPEVEQIVITEVDDQRVGFVVDYVIGEHQTVIKSLGKLYKTIEGVSGATILGDGTVALIVDAPKLVSAVKLDGVEAVQ
ncbi:MAG: chemotaxis protein CheA [Nitrospirae bacterium]|uniref:chemotaxis protein CheA n=1 Tax=Candidatus Magnetobacterium casense TaxID=1455061 RepID=UPI00058E4D24|nr:chemotaxis protein CheA [Candidatus Magnetobacterium casensis]MBF0337383.1 chemotaxis protein CheA [Nitrospirota bacterium]